MCVLMSVDVTSGSREWGCKSALEPYHAVGIYEKLVYLLSFRKYVKK